MCVCAKRRKKTRKIIKKRKEGIERERAGREKKTEKKEGDGESDKNRRKQPPNHG